MKKVQILLSTYNGEKYVAEQIDSLLSQSYPESEILIRDDGSTDKTLPILQNYTWGNNRIGIMPENNIGVVASFLELLMKSSAEASYFAFCDQDDVWFKDKLLNGIAMIDSLPEDMPVMYCSQLEIVDVKLSTLGQMPVPHRGPSFANALVQNIATGCTIIVNRAARDFLLKQLPHPSSIIMHDWWVYLVVSAFGKVVYDKRPQLYYRQHGSNSVGAKVDFLQRWVARIKGFYRRGRRLRLSQQAKEFQRIFAQQLPQNKAEFLDRFVNNRRTFIQRLWYACERNVYRQSKVDTFVLKILILFNRI
ncbi:glycosyltransferase family 2 protein [Aneurinibacillus sp. Ricciae_BoGa-3]|uniref:glycosyltransferase family 2 protein n=1 Tax=Aneurinibacillus sp. Ricciae_BoGa-3 TaxID=3022697 RepID=UPI0023407054|nr:glycosyltransferase family 2 protein [Aneurinibacillus sp. Ricciae_BoGa-3]WCK54286.1 glycosyltransferase family 2 protein [Aneurinibacillus sp. Ricciae_BoGa-3]